MTFGKAISAILISGAVLISGAQAESKGPVQFKDHLTDVRFDWKADSRTVTVTYFTGCLSAHRGGIPTPHVNVWLDRDYLQFDIEGGYRFRLLSRTKDRMRIGPADCMGSRSKSVTITDIEPETYLINRHGEEARTLKLGDEDISFVIPDPKRPGTVKKLPPMFKIAR